eukprot:15439676-Alexandrium_andersonii.AAC.1
MPCAAHPCGDACRSAARPSPPRAHGAPRCQRGVPLRPRAFARGPEPCSAIPRGAPRHQRKHFAQERPP